MFQTFTYLKTLGFKLFPKRRKLFLVKQLNNFSFACKIQLSKMGVSEIKYPVARRDESIIDDYHGIKVSNIKQILKYYMFNNNFLLLKGSRSVQVVGRSRLRRNKSFCRCSKCHYKSLHKQLS